MHEQIRNTGKFKPFQYIITHNFTTSSTIKVPQYSSGLKPKGVQWRRKCDDFQQKLHHLNGSYQYVCTELDKDCLIEAYIQSYTTNGNVDTKINLYGPISLPNDLLPLSQDIQRQNEGFQIEIISHIKSYQCSITFYPTQVTLKNKKSFQQYSIPLLDLVNSFVTKANNIELVTFPSIFLRIVVLKLFNEILAKGSYSDNNDPMMIKITDPYDDNPKIKSSKQWKRFLLKINNIKHDKSRRMTMPQINNSSPKLSIQPNEIQIKKHVDTRYSQARPTTFFHQFRQKQQNLKKSETYDRSLNGKNGNTKKSSNFVRTDSDDPRDPQSENQYFFQFQNVLMDQKQDDDDDDDAIDLDKSFEQLQKKSKSQREVQKQQYVKAKKKIKQAQGVKAKKLKQRLESVLHQQQELIKANTKLKKEIQKLEQYKSKNCTQAIVKARAQLGGLKLELQNLQQFANKTKEKKKIYERITNK